MHCRIVGGSLRSRCFSRIHSEGHTPTSSGAGIQPISASRKPRPVTVQMSGDGSVVSPAGPCPAATATAIIVSAPRITTITFMAVSSSRYWPSPRTAATISSNPRLSTTSDVSRPSRAPARPAVTMVTAASVMNALPTTTIRNSASAQVPRRR